MSTMNILNTVLVVVAIILMIVTMVRLHRVSGVLKELDRRDREREEAKARQRDAVQKMVHDYTRDCTSTARRFRGAGAPTPIIALVCVVLGALTAEVRVW